MTAGALERAVRRAGTRAQQAVERCEMCSLVVPPEHRHVLDGQRGEVMCVCRPCALLFERDVASRGHYRLVPERRLRVDVSAEALGAPVGLAFFVRQPDGAVVAHYPSPMGATQWEVDPEAWRTVVAASPLLGGMEPAVEAFLVDRARGLDERWLVPIDECYRLIAVVRREWKGLSGGSRVWPEIAGFFEELGRRAGGRRTTHV